MRILICAHDATITGGANRSLLMVIDGLVNTYGVEKIGVLVPRVQGDFLEALDKRGVKYYKSLYFGVTSSIRGDGKDWMRICKVYGGFVLESLLSCYFRFRLRNEKYDLIYTNTRGPILGAKLAQKLGIPHIVHVREFGAEKPIWGFWDYKKMYSMSDRIILISQALYNEYVQYIPKDKLIMIPNGINSPLGLPFHEHKEGETFNLVLTGRLVPDKGHKDAILALSELRKRNINDVHLYIVGSLQASMHMGWYETELKILVNKNGLEQYVTFCGEVSDMVKMRSKMDVELMTAIRETFGRVTIEGMRSGLVVIGSNTGGTVELIENGVTGLLYQQGNPIDLADKIQALYNDRELAYRLAYAGYRYTQTHYTAQSNVQQVYNTMREIIEKRKSVKSERVEK